MKNVLLLARNILKVTFRKKSNYLVYIAMPVLVILLSLSLTGLPTAAINIGVSNADQGALGADIVAALQNDKDISVTAVSQDDIKGKIQNRSIDCGIVIPQGFTQSIQNASPDNIDIVATGGQQTTILLGSIINVSVQNLKDLVAASHGDQAAFTKLYAAYQSNRISINTVSAGDETKSKNTTSNAVGFFVMFLMFGTTIAANLIVNEKTSRTYFRIVCAPVSSRQYLLGNLLTNLLIVVGQVSLVILSVTVLFHIELFMPVWQFFTVLMCFGVASIGIGFLIVSFSRDSQQVDTLQTLVIVPSSLLAGCFWPVGIMPDFMQKASYLMSQRWVLLAIQTLQQGRGFANVLPDLAVILAFALAFFMVAIYRFSRNEDMQTVV